MLRSAAGRPSDFYYLQGHLTRNSWWREAQFDFSCRGRILDAYENRPASDLLEYFHDHCVVRPPKIPPGSAARCDRRELADRIPGILFSGSRKSHRLRPIYGLSIEGNSRGDYTLRVHGFCLDLPGRGDHVELWRGFSLSGRRRDVCLLGQILGESNHGLPWPRRVLVAVSSFTGLVHRQYTKLGLAARRQFVMLVAA